MIMGYKIIRFRFNGANRIIKRGLSLAEAKAHCSSPKTRGKGWFDGYTLEVLKRKKKSYGKNW
jgi:hypothetical protein